MVLEMILATDLKSHFDYINRWSLLFPKRIAKSSAGMNGAFALRSQIGGKDAKGDDADNQEQKLRKSLSSNAFNSA